MVICYFEMNGKLVRKSLDSPFLLIGRSSECDLVIPNDTVSAKHASISLVNGKRILSDLNSTNGTIVNGEWISKKAIRAGDNVQFGGFECWVEKSKKSSQSKNIENAPSSTGKKHLKIFKITPKQPKKVKPRENFPKFPPL